MGDKIDYWECLCGRRISDIEHKTARADFTCRNKFCEQKLSQYKKVKKVKKL